MCSCVIGFFFFFKQKTAYELRISDWSSDVCSSDLAPFHDGCDRLSVAPIQHEYLAAFGRLEQCGNGAFWSRPIHQRWLRGDIIEIGRASCRERVCQYV